MVNRNIDWFKFAEKLRRLQREIDEAAEQSRIKRWDQQHSDLVWIGVLLDRVISDTERLKKS